MVTLQLEAAILNPSLETGFLSVTLEGANHTINSSRKDFTKAVDLFKEKKYSELRDLINVERSIAGKFLKYGSIEVKDGIVYSHGDPVHGVVVDRILQFLEAGLPFDPLVQFLDKLMQNPSRRAVMELYGFLEHQNLPLTDNGNFRAYKSVQDDFTDWRTGTFDNHIGNVLEMPRNKVDEDKDRTCSYGFHAGAWEYASMFGGPSAKNILIVEINPKDVVSIPSDYNAQKLRTCIYKVVGRTDNPLYDPLYASRYQDEGSDESAWDDEETDGKGSDEEYYLDLCPGDEDKDDGVTGFRS